MRQNLSCLAILTLLFSLAASAQDNGATNVDDENTAQTPAADSRQAPDLLPPVPPSYCNPCVFYSGDFKPKPASKEPNGLYNERLRSGATLIDGQVWVPFRVKKKITVQGLFVNELFATPPPSTASAKWAIRNGMSAGDAGQLQCSGTGTATATQTGRTFTFGGVTYTEWTYLLHLAPADYCELWNPAPPVNPLTGEAPLTGKGGCPPNCYMSLTTQDSSSALAPLALNFGYLSDVPNPAPHHFGLPNIYDNSFFTSTFYGANYVPATTACAGGPPVAITTVGCHMFSVGIIGTGK